jgi:hypothetical protein
LSTHIFHGAIGDLEVQVTAGYDSARDSYYMHISHSGATLTQVRQVLEQLGLAVPPGVFSMMEIDAQKKESDRRVAHIVNGNWCELSPAPPPALEIVHHPALRKEPALRATDL